MLFDLGSLLVRNVISILLNVRILNSLRSLQVVYGFFLHKQIQICWQYHQSVVRGVCCVTLLQMDPCFLMFLSLSFFFFMSVTC